MPRRCFGISGFVTLLVHAVSTFAADSPPGFEPVDQEIVIRALPQTMTYDVMEFSVRSGSRIKLVFVNDDGMVHNLVICRPGEGVTTRVGEAALALGAAAADREFVPDLPEVLFHTRSIGPGETDTIYFRAPEEEGAYPYVCTLPGHWFTMLGVMHVGEREPGYLRDLTFRYFRDEFQSVMDFDDAEPAVKGVAAGYLMDVEVAEKIPVGTPFGIHFRGEFDAPASGEYTFRTRSDDGVRLKIGDQVVVLDDGLHAARDASGKVWLEAGRHPFDLRYFDAGGRRELLVSFSGAGVPRTFLTTSEIDYNEFVVRVMDEARVIRLLLPDASTRAMAVGLPGGVNYCFDTADASVRFGWSGEFLDVGPHMRGRGGNAAEILGDRFEVGHVPFPFRIGDNDEPGIKYLGYRRSGTPQFLYSVDGVRIVQEIKGAPGSPGLTYRFEVTGHGDRPVRFSVNPENLLLSSSAGEWNQGTLTVSAAEAAEFTVTIQPEAGQTAAVGHRH